MNHANSYHLRGKKEVVKGKVIDQQGVHLDATMLENNLLKVGSGQVADVSDDYVSTDAEEIDGKMIDEDGVHLSKDDLLASLMRGMSPQTKIAQNKSAKKSSNEKKSSINMDFGIYQPVLDELSKIPFSENYQQEMKKIADAVKTAGMQFKVKKIIANTKSLSKNAQKFFYGENNVRFVFSILNTKYSLAAAGDFHGNEALHVQVDGDRLVGLVLRMHDDGDYTDVTEQYKIKIERA